MFGSLWGKRITMAEAVYAAGAVRLCNEDSTGRLDDSGVWERCVHGW